MQDLEYFDLLKTALLEKYRDAHPHFEGMLPDFKGREITNFQDMLMESVHGRISEKWFYTHLKVSKNEKLPRQDMLDLLAEFTGYLHWDDFKKVQQKIRQDADDKVGKGSNSIQASNQEKATEIDLKEAAVLSEEKPVLKKKASWYFLSAFLFLGLGFMLLKMVPVHETHEVKFCFINDFSKEAISDKEIKIVWLKTNESPQELPLDAQGCCQFKTEQDSLFLNIEGPYFQNRTLSRKLNNNHQETIQVQPDEFSLILDYFAKNDVQAWKEKRTKLNSMFAQNAMIIQLAPDGKTGMELYNKTEFINKLTSPLKSIKNIRFVEQKRNTKNQIESLKFMLK